MLKCFKIPLFHWSKVPLKPANIRCCVRWECVNFYLLLTFFCKHLATFICPSCLFRPGNPSSQCCCTTRTESWSICLWSVVDWLSSREAEWRGAPQPTGFSSCMFSDLFQILLLKRHLDRVLSKCTIQFKLQLISSLLCLSPGLGADVLYSKHLDFVLLGCLTAVVAESYSSLYFNSSCRAVI